jgi:hypothetical protein
MSVVAFTDIVWPYQAECWHGKLALSSRRYFFRNLQNSPLTYFLHIYVIL